MEDLPEVDDIPEEPLVCADPFGCVQNGECDAVERCALEPRP